MSNSDAGYKGWANHETWLFALRINNDQRWQESTVEQATGAMQEAIQEANDNNATNVRDDAVYALAKTIESSIEEMREAYDIPVSSVFTDLLAHAIGNIDFYEIAQAFINNIEVYVAGWNIPGYMPDPPAALFLDASDALEYIKEEIERHAAELNESDPDADALIKYDDDNNKLRLDANHEFSYTFNGYRYFVSRV